MQKNAVNVSVPLIVVVPVFVLFAACCLLVTGIDLNFDSTRGPATEGVSGLFSLIAAGDTQTHGTQLEILTKYGKPHGSTFNQVEDGTHYSVWMYKHESQLATFYFRDSLIYGLHYCKVYASSTNKWLLLDRDVYNEFIDLRME